MISGSRMGAIARAPLLVILASCAPPRDQSLESASDLSREPSVIEEMPGPAPRGRTFDAVAENARCEECHREIASEWRQSLHHQAHRDPVYLRQLEREPFAFCTRCHAPEAGPGERSGPRIDLGVGCVTCHLVGGHLLAAPGVARTSDHPLTRSEAFGGAAACAACHEFSFPDDRGPEPLTMQRTVSEHAASAYATTSCADCHMPRVEGHRSHRFAASGDEAMVRAAVVTEVSRAPDGTVVFRLSPGEVGHAVPTGDMLRRLTLTIEMRDPDGRVVAHQRRHLSRHFGFERGAHGPPRRVERRDERIGPRRAVVHRFRAPAAATTLVFVVRYERVADPTAPEESDRIAGSIVVAEGMLDL